MSTDPAALAADLETLHDAGVLTDPEYEDAKTRLAPPAPPALVPDPRLTADLDALHQAGVVTDAQYDDAKTRIPTIPADPNATSGNVVALAPDPGADHPALSPAEQELADAAAAAAGVDTAGDTKETF